MKKKGYIRFILGLMKEYKAGFGAVIGLLVLTTGLNLLLPYLHKLIIDDLAEFSLVGGEIDLNWIFGLVFAWIFVLVMRRLIEKQAFHLAYIYNYIICQKVHMIGFERLLELDYFSHTQKHSSSYTKIVEDADTSTWHLINWGVNRILPAGIGFVSVLVLAFWVSWQMTLVSLLVIPFGVAFVVFYIRKCESDQNKVNKLWQVKHEMMSDQISNMVTYKLNQNKNWFLNSQQAYVTQALNAQQEMGKKWRIAQIVDFYSVARLLVFIVGTWLIIQKEITIGTFVMFGSLLNEILVPIDLFWDILPEYSRRARHMEKFLKLMERKNLVVDPEVPLKLEKEKVRGEIEFRNVVFKYDSKNERPAIIKGISFKIEAGKTTALVGHSGAGKSTIMGLLTRLSDPTEGEILLNGVNIREFSQEDYRGIIGSVLQELAMYNKSVAENIKISRPDATQEQVERAAKAASADEFIGKLAKGYETLIGERGVKLSGGEKQRISIARAILKDPKLVILDEPTSALDAVTEAKVEKGIAELIEGRTSLVIAHRLSTVRHADKIIVLKEGRIVGEGKHGELMEGCAEYREMVELQVGGFLAE